MVLKVAILDERMRQNRKIFGAPPHTLWSNPQNRLRNDFSFKDELPVNMDSFLLYQYTCDTCNCIYISETKRHFMVRAYEHLRLSIRTVIV